MPNLPDWLALHSVSDITKIDLNNRIDAVGADTVGTYMDFVGRLACHLTEVGAPEDVVMQYAKDGISRWGSANE